MRWPSPFHSPRGWAVTAVWDRAGREPPAMGKPSLGVGGRGVVPTPRLCADVAVIGMGAAQIAAELTGCRLRAVEFDIWAMADGWWREPRRLVWAIRDRRAWSVVVGAPQLVAFSRMRGLRNGTRGRALGAMAELPSIRRACREHGWGPAREAMTKRAALNFVVRAARSPDARDGHRGLPRDGAPQPRSCRPIGPAGEGRAAEARAGSASSARRPEALARRRYSAELRYKACAASFQDWAKRRGLSTDKGRLNATTQMYVDFLDFDSALTFEGRQVLFGLAFVRDRLVREMPPRGLGEGVAPEGAQLVLVGDLGSQGAVASGVEPVRGEARVVLRRRRSRFRVIWPESLAGGIHRVTEQSRGQAGGAWQTLLPLMGSRRASVGRRTLEIGSCRKQRNWTARRCRGAAIPCEASWQTC